MFEVLGLAGADDTAPDTSTTRIVNLRLALALD
jgi:hypothetical protein